MEKFLNKIICGDTRELIKELPNDSIDCVITSPPYWNLRDYEIDCQIGIEKTPELYINSLLDIFSEVKRVLKPTGTCWVNLGDSYAGSGKAGSNPEYQSRHTEFGKLSTHKQRFGIPTTNCGIANKSLCNIPSRFAIGMTDKLGLIQRNTIIWQKNNVMPSSAHDRFTVDFEYLLFFTKQGRYYFEQQFEPLSESSIKDFNARKTFRNKGSNNVYACPGEGRDRREFYNIEKGRNKRCVWNINTKPFSGAHFAVFPIELIETPIKSGCPEDGVVLDIFSGAGTTAVAAKQLNRNYIGFEANPEYVEIAQNRIRDTIVNLELEL